MKDRLEQARAAWSFRGGDRPPFAVEPGPGQESVWDYPRPPAVVVESRPVRVELSGHVLAKSTRAVRVLETASAPTVYVMPEDVDLSLLTPESRGGVCEWKGPWHLWSVEAGGDRVRDAAWSYPEPFEGYEALAGWLSFYPSKLDCYLGEEQAAPQPGGFYGGWVTAEIVGPIKGEPGTVGW